MKNYKKNKRKESIKGFINIMLHYRVNCTDKTKKPKYKKQKNYNKMKVYDTVHSMMYKVLYIVLYIYICKVFKDDFLV